MILIKYFTYFILFITINSCSFYSLKGTIPSHIDNIYIQPIINQTSDQDISDLIDDKLNDLLNIDGIGDTQVNSIKNFLANNMNLKVLDELNKLLHIQNAISEKKNGLLKDKTFLVTGKLLGISRAEAKSLIEKNSGTTVSSVSKKLNYLIVGEKPTKRKVDNAKDLKIKIIDQDQFLKMLKKTS